MLLNCGAGEDSESSLDSKEIKSVNSKGNQSWIFIGRTDIEAEAPVLWPRDMKTWLIGKDPDAGKDWRQEEKGTTEDEMGGWHHWLAGWVWVNSWSWWWTGRPGVLRFMGTQIVRQYWATELNLFKLLSAISGTGWSSSTTLSYASSQYIFFIYIYIS